MTTTKYLLSILKDAYLINILNKVDKRRKIVVLKKGNNGWIEFKLSRQELLTFTNKYPEVNYNIEIIETSNNINQVLVSLN